MYYLYIKIVDPIYKEDVFLAMQSVEITKASFVEARDLDHLLMNHLPVFKEFVAEEEKSEDKVYLINALVKEKDKIIEFVELLRESGIAVENQEIIRVLFWKVESAFDYLSQD